MHTQCENCTKECIGKEGPEKVCDLCIFNTKKHRLKECIDCGVSCQFVDKTKRPQPTSYCRLCGSNYQLEEHHLMRGSHRKMAELYGYKVMLCHDCHQKVTNDQELDRQLRRIAEDAHISIFGKEDLIKKFGKCNR